MLILAFGFALLLLLLAAAGHHSEAVALREWEMILNPEGARLYDQVSGVIGLENARVQESYSEARSARDEGRMDEALRFLRIGASVVGECSESLLQCLRSTWTLSRSAAAIAPMPTLRPAGFQARELATLAGLHAVAHHLLVTTRERLALRLAVLRCGVRAAAALLLRATWRTRETPDAPEGWRRVEALRLDLGTLTDESLASLRAVLGSLAAVRRPAPEKETA